MKRVSDKKRKADAAYAKSRVIVMERAYGRCEANTPACPPREHAGTQCHHVLRRSAGGGHDPSNLLYVCDAAHDHIHGHVEESLANGWLRSRYEAKETE